MERVTILVKPPFDKPLGFTKLLEKKMRLAMMGTIHQVKDNAVVIAAQTGKNVEKVKSCPLQSSDRT